MISLFYSQSILWQIGTDIEDFKCSWLFVEALQRADEKQKDFLFVRPMDYI
jgi:farnesyl diphosphate synthase